MANQTLLERLLDKEKLTVSELGQLSDLYWETKTKRLAADKVSKALKTEESAAEAKLIEQMQRQKVTAVGGQSVILKLNPAKDEPAVTDWAAFWEYIKQKDDMSLFEKRPGRAAIKERWEQGETIPGVTKFPVHSLSKEGVK